MAVLAIKQLSILDKIGILSQFVFCLFFQFQDVDYFTWADRQGVDHPLVPTNSSCNLKSPVWMSNKGEVTDISQLPIKNIKYGPLQFQLEQVKVVIGPRANGDKSNQRIEKL